MAKSSTSPDAKKAKLAAALKRNMARRKTARAQPDVAETYTGRSGMTDAGASPSTSATSQRAVTAEGGSRA